MQKVFKNLIMLSSENITIVVQGMIIPKLTRKVLKSVRRYLPQARIILSTWQGSDTSDLDFDELVLCEDPGFFYHSKHPGIRPNNINRQIVSTLSGVQQVKTPYVLKLRTDFRLTGAEFLKYFETQPNFNPEYKVFTHKILACCYCTRNPHDKTFPYPFHPADIAFLGLTEDILKLFDIPLMDEKEAYWDAENEYFNQYAAEQHLFVNCLRKQGKKINCVYYKDCSPQNVAETEQYFTSNFIFINYKNFNLLPSKPNFFAKNELHSFETCYTQAEFSQLYNQLQNDKIKIPLIDKERLLINVCLVIEKISKGFARSLFFVVPIRKIRKTYRPMLAEALYKILTYFL